MKIFRNASIQNKQTLIIMLTTGMALLLACAAFGTYEVLTFRKGMLVDLATMAEIVGDESASAMDFNDPERATETLSALKAEHNIVGACIFLKNGELFAKYERAGDGRAFVPPPFQPSGYAYGRRELRLYDPIDYKGDVIGVVYIASDMHALYSRLEQYAAIAAVVFLATLFAAWMLSERLQRMVSEPILHLVKTARAVAEDRNYSLRALKRNEDELGVLTDGFNAMLDQIQDRDAALQAHHNQLECRVEERTQELATSLSLLRATLESATDGILVVNAETQITNYNEKFLTMWQVPRALAETPGDDQVLKLGLTRLKYPEQFLAKVQELYATPERESFDVLEFKDGRFVERYSVPQRVGEKTVGRVWNFRDVTERKKAAEELEKAHGQLLARTEELAHSLSLLHATLDSSTDGILVTDSGGRVTNFNDKFLSLWQIPRAIAEERNIEPMLKLALTHLKDPEDFMGRVQAKGRQLDAESFDVLEFKDGRIIERYMIPQRLGETVVGRVTSFRDITARKRAETQLETAHQQLLDISRQAGMAEVATSVLHNVGNVLNSVNISGSLVAEKVRNSKSANLAKVVQLLEAHKDDLPGFFGSDPKGLQVPGYLAKLAVHLADEQEEIETEIASLTGNIEHIKEIVAMQQSYARVLGVVESHQVVDLVEDALRMNAGAMDRHQVTVVRDYRATPTAVVDKHKVLQILVNLIRNAKYAMDELNPAPKLMTLRVESSAGKCVRISVIDNGVGIPESNLTLIFGHGFTTRKEGHGFGLHSGALAAKEMGGSLTVRSDGPGKGATFTLEIPCQTRERI